MAKKCRKSPYRVGFIVVFTLLLIGCGLPTTADYCPPPEVLSATGSSARVRLPAGADIRGFVLFYRVKSQADLTEDQFTSGGGVGETVFTSRRYYKAMVDRRPSLIWTPAAATQFPVEVILDYATQTDPFIRATITDANGVVDIVEIRREDGISGFNAIRLVDRDAGGLSGNVDIALAMMSFNLNTQTMNLNPSVGVYVDRMRNFTIS